MKLESHVLEIEVFYDGRCGMCCTFHEWVNRQPRALAIRFIPYQAAEAEAIFPGLSTLDPAREMVVRTDTGEIYRGAEAWVWCLFSCEKHQDIARKLAGPTMLPWAMKTCRLLAANRLTLSKIFFLRKDREVRQHLHQMKAPTCNGDFCS